MREKYKHEDIVHIQNALWEIYKGFLADKDMDRYNAQTSALVGECNRGLNRELGLFCWNLVSVWHPVVDGFSVDFRNGRDTELRTAEIKHIQNTVWVMYKGFRASCKAKEYTREAESLVHKYDGKEIRPFCENLILAWVPVINGLAEEFRNGAGD